MSIPSPHCSRYFPQGVSPQSLKLWGRTSYLNGGPIPLRWRWTLKMFHCPILFFQLSRCGPLMSMTQECHREILIQDHPTSTSTMITTTAISKTTSTTGSWARLPTSKEGLKELRKTRARLVEIRCQGTWIFYFYSGFCLQGFGQEVQQAVDDERESELVAKRENEENEVCLEPCKPFLLRCISSSDVSLAFA